MFPHQRRALRELRQRKDILVVNCDKNLGPAVIERSRYIQMALSEHLTNQETYERLTRTEAMQAAADIKDNFEQWMETWEDILTKNEKFFLKTKTENIPLDKSLSTFYLLMKVHKTPLLT